MTNTCRTFNVNKISKAADEMLYLLKHRVAADEMRYPLKHQVDDETADEYPLKHRIGIERRATRQRTRMLDPDVAAAND